LKNCFCVPWSYVVSVILCIVGEHNPWLVVLAALVCVSGATVTFRLFAQALERQGFQRAGWTFLAAMAGGSSVWCTHFVAMLAYDVGAPVAFDPILTMVSLLVVIAGMAYGIWVSLFRRMPFAAELGGCAAGFSIAAMHYTGMAAYHVDGIVTWNHNYVFGSIALAVIISAAAFNQAIRRRWKFSPYLACGLFVLAVVSLHFTGMTAVSVTPLGLSAESSQEVLEAMAIAVAGVGMLIVAAGVVSYLIDTQTTREAFTKLRHLALNDPLTGLPNRVAGREQLDAELKRAKISGSRVAVIGIDLNRFKEINDLRGHKAGDEALRIIGARLSACTSDNEFVARLGGDEFLAIKGYAEQAQLLDFVDRLEKSLFEPLRIDDFESIAGASLGIATYPSDGTSQDELIVNADLAMYRAKADLTRAACFYEPRMDQAARERQAISQDLSRAIQLDQLELHYQVQKSVATGETGGYEALLRWRHPEKGLISPATFIPIAEETGLILSIGEWVLRTACRDAVSWDHPYRVAVNLSPVQFAHCDLSKLVSKVLEESGLDPRRLELEITESTIIADKERALHLLRQIRKLGVTVAIDDFGTGYSSLDTLRTFPFDKIKLDRSFMSEVEGSAQAKAIVRAVLALGKSLDIPVLAEGVETHRQLQLLEAEGCDEAQGYYLGRPAALDAGFQPAAAA
jgi:diguanylate cyclase (GGDEF)-like protein